MQLRKIAVGALGLMTAMSTVGFAATLADYPAPFATGGAVNSLIVVGATAASSDVVGAINLGARLAGESYTSVATGATTTGTVSGGGVYSKDVAFDTNLGSSTGIKSPLKSFDVDALKTGSVTFDGSTYNWEESFTAGDAATAQIETSAVSGGNKDMKDIPYLRYGLGDLGYNWSFTTSFNSSAISTSKPLQINILGKAFKITSVANGSFTASIADEKYLIVGQTFTATDSAGVTRTVKLIDVADASVIVDVDGTQKVLSTKNTAETVNNLQVAFTSTFYKSNAPNSSAATIQAGSDITKTYNNGDAFPGEDKNNPNWIWDLGSGTSAGVTLTPNLVKHTFRVKFNKNVNLLTDTPAPLAPAQSLVLPNNYLKFGFDSITTHNKAQYKVEYVSAVDLSQAGLSSSAAVLKLSTTAIDGFTVTSGSGSPKTKTIYIVGTAAGGGTPINVTYVDSNNKVVSQSNFTGTGKFADIVFQDTTLNVHWTNTSGSIGWINITEPTLANRNTSVRVLLSSSAIGGFGATANSAEAVDIITNGTEIGTRDEDTLTAHGVIIRAPKSNAGSDRLVIDVPSTQLKGFISLRAGSAQTANTTTSGTTKSVVPVTGGLAKLDTTVTDADKTGKNLVLVGGPCRNTLVQQMAAAGQLKRGTVDLTCNNWPGENFGVIRVVDNYFATGRSALVIAGTRAEETTLGTQIMSNFAAYADKLKGTGVEYSGADVSSVVFK